MLILGLVAGIVVGAVAAVLVIGKAFKFPPFFND